jgi:guanosine-3',5'-bis(diphosphate) 3'-pyrophosphohydrolase
LDVTSERGVIANLASAISDTGANILKIDMSEKEGQLARVDVEIAVMDRVHLATTIRRLRAFRTVTKVTRI